MNWKKMKTILIIIFFILDMFLGYRLIVERSYMNIPNRQTAQIKTLLAKNNITLNCDLPTKNEISRRLNIQNNAYDAEELAIKILGTDIFNKIESVENNEIYEVENENLTINKNGKIKYVSKNNIELFQNRKINFQKYVLDKVNTYLNTNNFVLEYKHENEEEMQIAMKYMYQGKYEIINNYLTATIYKNGTLIITSGAIVPLDYSNKEKKVSYIDSLIELLSILDKEMELNNIELGFYINVETNDSILKSGEATPTWKFSTDLGNIYFDAYNIERIQF